MSAAASYPMLRPGPDPVVAAMVAAGWSDAQIGAALRAALSHAQPSQPVRQEPSQHSHSPHPAGGAGHPPRQGEGREARQSQPSHATVADEPSQAVRQEPSQPVHTREARLRAAIAGHEGLSRAAVRVGLAILDRHDAKTGLCACGVAHLSLVARCDRATVFRALARLEAFGLFERRPYAGMRHCNAYRPIWDGGDSVTGANSRKNATVATLEGRDRRTNATQSQRENITTSLPRTESQRGRTRKPPDPRQRSLMLPITGGQPRASEVAAAIRAGERREDAERGAMVAALNAQAKGQPWHEAAMFALLYTEGLARRCAKAERLGPGGMVAVLLDHLDRQDAPTGTDPP